MGSACWGPPGSDPAPLGAGGGREVPRLAGGSPALCFPQEAGFCSGGQRGDLLVQRLLALQSPAGPSLPAGHGVRQRLMASRSAAVRALCLFWGVLPQKEPEAGLEWGFQGVFPKKIKGGAEAGAAPCPAGGLGLPFLTLGKKNNS